MFMMMWLSTPFDVCGAADHVAAANAFGNDVSCRRSSSMSEEWENVVQTCACAEPQR